MFKIIFLPLSDHSVEVKQTIIYVNSVCCWNNKNPTNTVRWRNIKFFLVNPSTPELNPSAQRWLTRFFTWYFAS
jgi:hypothetical protein